MLIRFIDVIIHRSMKKYLIFSLLFLLVLAQSCEKEGKCGETNISQAGSRESHNMGLNCMNCHKSGGEGEGCFKAAGTVYDSLLTTPKSSGTIRLYSGPNGTGSVVATIAVDAKGNFHTTDEINFGSGVYPSVTNASGQTNYMSSSITQGACNSCHGISNDRIWIN